MTLPSASGPSSACTCLALRKAARRVTQVYESEMAGTGITITQYSILGHLRRLDAIALGALADVLVMDATTLVRTLKPLEDKGLVASTADPADSRVRQLHLTARGLESYRSAKPAWARAQHRVAEALGETDSAQLSASIDRLLLALDG